MEEMVQYLIVLVLYLLVVIIWAIYKGRDVKDKVDYTVAGRRLPGWIAALSERAAGESAWALLGLPGAAYLMGLSKIWTAIGCFLGVTTMWSFLALKFRNESIKYNATSYIELLGKKLNDNTKYFRPILSFIIVFFFFFYVGAQFIGGGKVFNTLFSIDLYIGIIIMALVIIPYAIYGGMKSVIYADVIQSILMIIILIIVPIYASINLMYEKEVFASSAFSALSLAGEKYTSILGEAINGFTLGIFLQGISWFFCYLGGQPQLNIRFMTIKDEKNIKVGRNVSIVWTLLAYFGALMIGWLGIAYFGPNTLSDHEQVLPLLLKHLFHPLITGLLITAIIAAMLSTADALIIVSSIELSENIIKKFFSKGNDLFVSRMVTFLLATCALIASFITPTKIIFNLVGYVWAAIGGTFSAIVLLSFFWEKFNSKSALITAILGVIFTVVWINTKLENIISSRIMTFFFSLFVGYLSTILFTKKKENYLG